MKSSMRDHHAHGARRDRERGEPNEAAAAPRSKTLAGQHFRLTLDNAKAHPCIIAIVGSVDFYNKDSPALCDAIGHELALACDLLQPRKIGIWTGGNGIVAKRLSQAFHAQSTTPRVCHLVPENYECDWQFGQVVTAGRDMAERRRLLATSATMVISIEGGPGTADEMTQAIHAGVPIIPVIRTGGAFHAPAIARPGSIDEHDWDLLWNNEASIESCARAVVRIIYQIYKSQASSSTCGRPVLPDGYDYVPPALANCAHLVFSNQSRGVGNIFLVSKFAAGLDARDELVRANVGGIANCTPRVPCYHRDQGTKYCIMSVNDDSAADILAYLEGATLFIHEMLCSNQSILVHCEMGVSRSATVVIAYLIRYNGWNDSGPSLCGGQETTSKRLSKPGFLVTAT